MCLRENPVSREAGPELQPPCFHPLAGGAEGNSQASLGSGQGEWTLQAQAPRHVYRPSWLCVSVACTQVTPWPPGLFFKTVASPKKSIFVSFHSLDKSLVCQFEKHGGERAQKEKKDGNCIL